MQKALTAKMRKFVREVADGKSLSDAYRAAYDTAGMNPGSIRREASRLMSNPNIATMVEHLQREADAEIIQKRVATREEVLQSITKYMLCAENGDAVKLRAAELMGKHYGLFTDRLITEAPRRSSREIEAELVEKLSRWTEEPERLPGQVKAEDGRGFS